MLNSSGSTRGTRSHRWVYLLLILTILTANACTLPLPWKPEETAQPTQVAQPPTPVPTQASNLPPTPQPQATAVPLPPALVEVNPMPQSEIGPKTTFTFYFNQSMERGSVQAALQAQPAVSGSFEWANDTTVKFTPDKSLPLNTDLAVSFKTQARATNGLALTAPVEIAFHTSAGFSLADQLPKPNAVDADPSSAVVATFTRPMVPLGADSKTLPAAFNLEPAAKGRSEWLNTSTYIFYPDPPLLGGIEYSVRVNTSLTAVDGAPWSADQKTVDWKFKTSRPSLLSVSPDGKTEVYLDAPFILNFNQPMDPISVQQGLSLKAPGGEAVTGKFTWNENGNQLTFQPDGLLKRAVKYQLALSGKVQARGGAALEKDFGLAVTTVPDFGVRSSEPANNGILQLYDVYGGVRIRFTSPLAKQDLVGKFTFKPVIGDALVASYAENEVYISGIYAPRTDYTLTIPAGLQDKWGQALKEPVIIRFQTPAPPASLGLATVLSDNVAFITPAETALSGRATNIKTLQVGYAVLSLTDFAHNASISSYERAQKYTGPRLANFEKTLALPADKSTPVDLPLNPAGKALQPGLYFYQIQSPDVKEKIQPASTSVLLVVSRIHLTIKSSQNQLTVWAVNLDTNVPVNGATLAIYTSSKNGDLSQVGTIKTDAQGLARLDYAFPANTYTPIYAVLGKPNDADFSLAMSTWSQGVNAYEYGLPVELQAQPLHAYLYTDRPIYRPGQQVDFRLMVHRQDNGRYAPAGLKQATVKVMGEFSRTTGERQIVYQSALPISEYGTASGSFNLAENTAPGYYTIGIAEVEGSELSFQVANYRKPEVDLQTSFSPADLKAGDAIRAAVNAKYYFGAPAANLTLHWTLTAQPSWFILPEGYQSGPVDTGWLLPRWYMPDGMGTFIAEGQVRTTPDGKAEINVPGQVLIDKVDENRLQQISLQVSLTDEQELPVSSHTQALVHPANLYIGLRSDSWSGRAKAESGFSIQTYDWKKGPVANRKLSALFQRVVYSQKANWNYQSGSLPFTAEMTKIASTDFQVDSQGRARIAFTPPEPGTYQVEVSGDGAISQLLFWVGGEGRAVWPVLPDQHIRLVNDATEYQAGQTAKILIPNPFGEKTLALITVERAKVMKTEVIKIDAASLEWELPLTDDYAPNVFVSVLLVGTGSAGTPEFRQGYSELTVSPRALQLNIELTSQPETAAPGGEVRLGLRVKDSQGKAVQGEFSLSVVDKAVLALADANAPVIQESFYGRQPIGVSTSLALAVYGRPRQRDVVQAAGGRGGGGGGLAPQVVRTDFRDTAFWSGALVTEASGFVEIPVKLPDNLTTWVVTVRGLNREMRVGEATREVVVSKDLLIRPVTPRFLVAGDHIQLAALVNNNTAGAISVDVNLQATGLELDTPAQATQKVNLPAQGRARVTWWGKAQDIDKVDLVFSAKGGGLEDASKPAGGSIPVLRYSVPQTYGTSGILNDPGEILEVISAPRSFTPTGGELRVELSPSLAAAILSGLKALDTFPVESAEPTMSRLLANLETYQVLQKLGLEAPELRAQLEPLIQDSVSRLISWQNSDGGWGWMPEGTSDAYLSTYVLFGLSEAVRTGVQVSPNIIKKAGDYVTGTLVAPTATTKTEQLDRQAFQQFVLQQAGRGQKNAGGLYDFRERLAPWARALLALTLSAQSSTDERVRGLISDLQAQSLRSATGAHWETKEGLLYNLSTPVFTTAVVSLALARLDPAAAVLTDAVRYLAAHRNQAGCWASSYESTWVIMALGEVLRASGELSASFAFSADLNGAPLLTGKAGGPNTLAPVESRVALQSLLRDQPNALKIRHDMGSGRLYYRAFLQVYRPVEQVPALDSGLVISRKITLAGQDCTKTSCQAVSQVKLADQRELVVRLTLTLPQAMYNLVVEDFIPAGAEIVDASLKTAPKNVPVAPGSKAPDVLQYLTSNPFGGGWNWWLFGTPRLYDDHIRWNAAYLPAGTYELTYRLTPLQAGEYRLLPAHAYETYFPDVEGTSAGAIFRIDQ